MSVISQHVLIPANQIQLHHGMTKYQRYVSASHLRKIKAQTNYLKTQLSLKIILLYSANHYIMETGKVGYIDISRIIMLGWYYHRTSGNLLSGKILTFVVKGNGFLLASKEK